MHSAVLVIGASNQEELAKALEPFFQLGCTMSQEEQKDDPRAELEIEHTKEEAEEQYKKEVIDRPTKNQFIFFRDNFMEISDEETCQKIYKEKKNNPHHAPNGYLGEDFAYGSVKISNEFGFILISEEKMLLARKWVKEKDLNFWNTMHNNCKKDFIAKTPDAYALMTGDQGMIWSEELQGYGYYHNPNGFWDWYQVGGRWVGFFTLTEEADRERAKLGDPSMLMQFSKEEAKKLRDKADVLRVKDIDFDKMEENTTKYNFEQWDKIWEMINEHRQDKTDKEVMTRFREIMDSPDGETKEEYIERNKSFSVASIVMAGEWFDHEKDGFYRCKSDGLKGGMIAKELTMLLKNMQPETPLMLVDCHG